MGERLKFGTKVLSKLTVGNLVSVQNQVGPRAEKWDKTGVIVEVLPYDQYRIKMGIWTGYIEKSSDYQEDWPWTNT